MKQGTTPPSAEQDTMRPEYDFTSGVRGKHAAAMRQGIPNTIDRARCGLAVPPPVPGQRGADPQAPHLTAPAARATPGIDFRLVAVYYVM